jgi:hypothetical protein
MDIFIVMHHNNLHIDKTGSSLVSQNDDITRVIPKYRHTITSLNEFHFNRRICEYLIHIHSITIIGGE